MTTTIHDFIRAHAWQVRHGGVDVHFFGVDSRSNPNVADLRRLIDAWPGEFAHVNLFDKKEHSYIEIGAWLGDQGSALMLMGLGQILGLWQVYTPRGVLGPLINDEQAEILAGNGMVTIKAT